MSGAPPWKDDLDRVATEFDSWDALADAQVLITGASGLIGRYLTELLLHPDARARGVVPTAVGRSTTKLQELFGDRLSVAASSDGQGLEALVAESRYVIHCAGAATPATIAADPVGTMASNIDYLGRLLDAAREGPRVVVVSSAEIYGRVEVDRPLRESDLGWLDLLAPRSSYPVAKRAAETLLAAHAAEYGVDGVVVRPAYIYGPTLSADDDRVVPQFVRSAVAGGPIVLNSDGSAVRSYCYVGDCVTGVLTAAVKGRSTTAYNIADPDGNVSVRHLAQLVGQLTSTEVTFANPHDAVEPDVASSTVVLDPSELVKLGWRPSTPLPEGLGQTVAAVQSSPVPSSAGAN